MNGCSAGSCCCHAAGAVPTVLSSCSRSQKQATGCRCGQAHLHKPPSQPETSQPEPVPFAFDSDTEDVGAAADAQPPPEDAPPPSPPLAQRRQVRVAARRPASEWQDDAYRITGRSNVAANAAIANEPSTMKEALSGPDAAAWQLAMDDEMASLIANDTWTLCEPPHGTKPIPAKCMMGACAGVR